MRWDPPPRRASGADVAGGLGAGAPGSGWRDDLDRAGAFIPDKAAALLAHASRGDLETETFVAHTLRGEGFDASEDGTGRGTPLVPVESPVAEYRRRFVEPLERIGDDAPVPLQGTQRVREGKQRGLGIGKSGDPMFTLDTRGDHAMAFDVAQVTHPENRTRIEPGRPSPSLAKENRVHVAFSIVPESGQGADLRAAEVDVAPALTTEEAKSIDRGTRIASTSGVRRLTPRECERLQGFPDDYTLVPWRTYQDAARKGVSYEALLAERGMRLREPAGEECPDGPRYRAIGNSMAVPVMRWIGKRVLLVQGILDREAA